MSELDFTAMHNNVYDFLAENCDDFIFQLERGLIKHELHYQGWIKVDPKIRSKTLAVDWNPHFPGVEISEASNSGNVALKTYVMKPETRVAGPWGKRPIYTGANDLACMVKPNGFQQTIIDIIAGDPDDRKIHYLFEPTGGVGKSKLTKFLCFKKIAKKIPMGNATQLKTFICHAGPARCYLIDIPRTTGTTEKLADLYSAIEEVKNGFVQSPMYGKMHELFMDPPHIFVFSNAKPNIYAMSRDKWKIGEIKVNKAFKVTTINWVDANKFKRKRESVPIVPKKTI